MSDVTPIRPGTPSQPESYAAKQRKVAEQLEAAISAIGEPQAILGLLEKRFNEIGGDEDPLKLVAESSEWSAALRVAYRLLSDLWSQLEAIKCEAAKPDRVT